MAVVVSVLSIVATPYSYVHTLRKILSGSLQAGFDRF